MMIDYPIIEYQERKKFAASHKVMSFGVFTRQDRKRTVISHARYLKNCNTVIFNNRSLSEYVKAIVS